MVSATVRDKRRHCSVDCVGGYNAQLIAWWNGRVELSGFDGVVGGLLVQFRVAGW